MQGLSLKADDGNRTRLPSLGSWCSTDELHLRKEPEMGLEPATYALRMRRSTD